MLAVHSIEKKISDAMARLNVSAEFLGQLTSLYGISGLSQPRISQALRGAKPFETVKGEQLLTLIQEITELCETSDVPVSLVNPALIKDKLDQRRAFKLSAKYDETAIRELLGVQDV
jgi:hypothetical protein